MPASDEKQQSLFKAEDFEWLAGQWSGAVEGEITGGFWMEPRGNMMVGGNRSFRASSSKTSFEYMRIADGSEGLSCFASPTGRPARAFPVKKRNGQTVVFENVKNDFPTQIRYHRDGDTLHAKITGSIKKKPAEMPWTWKRVVEHQQ